MFSAVLRASRASVLPKTWARSQSTTPGVLGVADILESLPPTSPPTAGPGGWGEPKAPGPRKIGAGKAAVPETRLRLHCHSTPNNTIATLTDKNGATIAWFSGGSCGFKKGNRATYEAGYQCAVRTFRKIEDISKTDGRVRVDLFFKGFGQGRDALRGALLATEGEFIRPLIRSVTDRTPIKIGGTRAKKMPRN